MKYTINDHKVIQGEHLETGKILLKEGNNYRFLYKEKNYDINVLHYDAQEKLFDIKVNGYRLKIRKIDELSDLIAKLGFNLPPKLELKEVRAPMPGLVKEIFIAVGDQIQTGDNLFVLEAMKMENIIKASGEGIVSAIPVKKGDKVDKSGLLAKL